MATVYAIAAMVLLGAGLGWLVTRDRAPAPVGSFRDAGLRLLSRKRIGRDSTLAMVCCADRLFVLGAGPGRLTLVSELRMDGLADLAVAEDSRFGRVFGSVLESAERRSS